MCKCVGLFFFCDNFFVECVLFEVVVFDIDKDNVLREMSKMAVNTFDVNLYWKYVDKI